LPTKDWNIQDLEMVIAEAYVYQKIFSEKHWFIIFYQLIII
jgi:hypothetical protein